MSSLVVNKIFLIVCFLFTFLISNANAVESESYIGIDSNDIFRTSTGKYLRQESPVFKGKKTFGLNFGSKINIANGFFTFGELYYNIVNITNKEYSLLDYHYDYYDDHGNDDNVKEDSDKSKYKTKDNDTSKNKHGDDKNKHEDSSKDKHKTKDKNASEDKHGSDKKKREDNKDQRTTHLHSLMTIKNLFGLNFGFGYNFNNRFSGRVFTSLDLNKIRDIKCFEQVVNDKTDDEVHNNYEVLSKKQLSYGLGLDFWCNINKNTHMKLGYKFTGVKYSHFIRLHMVSVGLTRSF